MTPHPVHRGIDVRRSVRADGSVAETFTVRWKEPDGRKPRRTFDTLQDALDYKAKRRSAKRWRPEELRQESAGRLTLAEFFEEWWLSHGIVELKRSTLRTYRYLWEAHAAPRLGEALVDAKRSLATAWQVLDGTDGAAPGVEHVLRAALTGIDAIHAIEHVNGHSEDLPELMEVEDFWDNHASLPGFAVGTGCRVPSDAA